MTMTTKNNLHFQFLTLFPEMFPSTLGLSLAGQALKKNIWSFETVNIRDYSNDKHKNIDCKPYGGGAGMVIKPDVLGEAIEKNVKKGSKLLYMSPRGSLLNQKKSYQLSKEKNISIICGRFEGIDQRVIDKYNVEEVSIGDYILSGGEIAAIALVDTIVRLLPDVIGNSNTLLEESFGENQNYSGLLEYPLYTKPFEWSSHKVPEVLLSGNHKKIEKWRLEKAEEITFNRRKDLWNRYINTKKIVEEK